MMVMGWLYNMLARWYEDLDMPTHNIRA